MYVYQSLADCIPVLAQFSILGFPESAQLRCDGLAAGAVDAWPIVMFDLHEFLRRSDFRSLGGFGSLVLQLDPGLISPIRCG